MNFLNAVRNFLTVSFRVSRAITRLLTILVSVILLVPVVSVAVLAPLGLNEYVAYVMVPIMIVAILLFAWFTHVIAAVAVIAADVGRAVAAGIAVAFAVQVLLAVVIFFVPTKDQWGACMLLASVTLALLLLMGTQGGVGWVRRASWAAFALMVGYMCLTGHAYHKAKTVIVEGLKDPSTPPPAASPLVGLAPTGTTSSDIWSVGRDSKGNLTMLPGTIFVKDEIVTEKHPSRSSFFVHTWNVRTGEGEVYHEYDTSRKSKTRVKDDGGVIVVTRLDNGKVFFYTSDRSEAETIAERLKL